MTYEELKKYIEEQDTRTGRDTHSIILTQGQADSLIADATLNEVKACKKCECVKEVRAYAKVGGVIVFTNADYWFDFKFDQAMNDTIKNG